jgi:transposase
VEKILLSGVDVHDKTLVTKTALGRGKAERRNYENTPADWARLAADLRARSKREGGVRIVVGYEASGQGFGLYDYLAGQGLECHVLAPTRIPRSPQQRKRKNDDADAELILDVLRGHYLAGHTLPAVRVPSRQLRDDREITRATDDVKTKLTEVKVQIQCLLKRHQVRRPKESGKGWTAAYRQWLAALSERDAPLPYGSRVALGALLRQLAWLDGEADKLLREVGKLAEAPRHVEAVRALSKLAGVGVWTALVFLLELGDPGRFRNRRQVGAHAGLVPSSHDSGETVGRNGHITRQGPARLRKALCQAVWARIRGDSGEKAAYERIVKRNPKHKKIAVVACMRRLLVRMWHEALRSAAA